MDEHSHLLNTEHRDIYRIARNTTYSYEQDLRLIICSADSVSKDPKVYEFAKKVLCRLIMLVKAGQVPFKLKSFTHIINDYVRYESEDDADYHTWKNALEEQEIDVEIENHKAFRRVLETDIPYDIMNSINTFMDEERRSHLRNFGLIKNVIVEPPPVEPVAAATADDGIILKEMYEAIFSLGYSQQEFVDRFKDYLPTRFQQKILESEQGYETFCNRVEALLDME
jgi:hypothetical protein